MKHKAIKISITTLDGEVLDSFVVTHWRTEIKIGPGITKYELEDYEGCGSPASDSGIMYRIKRYVSED